MTSEQVPERIPNKNALLTWMLEGDTWDTTLFFILENRNLFLTDCISAVSESMFQIYDKIEYNFTIVPVWIESIGQICCWKLLEVNTHKTTS